MNPLWANPQHELHFVGNSPGLLEQKIDAPFRRVTPKKWRNADLEFQPVLYRRHLDRDCGTEARLTFRETPVSSGSQLKDGRTFLLDRLRKRAWRGCWLPRRLRMRHNIQINAARLAWRRMDGNDCASLYRRQRRSRAVYDHGSRQERRVIRHHWLRRQFG